MSQSNYDVAIIGSGVAGALIAYQLAKAGIKVCVLEAGPEVNRGEALQRYAKALIKVPTSPYEQKPHARFPQEHLPDGYYQQAGPEKFKSTYVKAVGGTTWHWLGSCPRFVASDFKMRTLYGVGVDWPFSYDDLRSDYRSAEQELGVAGGGDTESSASDLPIMPAIAQSYLDKVLGESLQGSPYRLQVLPQARNSTAYDGRPACCGSASCIPICPIGAKYDASVHVKKALKAGAELLYNHPVIKLELDSNSTIISAQFRRPDGSAGKVSAKYFVVACHAIETPRLLLHSANQYAVNGLGNSSGMLGRNLMDHPVQLSWALSNKPVYPYRGPLVTSGMETQRDGKFRSQYGAYRVDISNQGWMWPTGGPNQLAEMLISKGYHGEKLQSMLSNHIERQVMFSTEVEQLPNPNNRISLDETKRDAHGVPMPKIDFHLDDYVHKGMEAARNTHKEIFRLLGVTEENHSDSAQGAGHIIGTTCMGVDPRNSVVDSTGRCHDHANLYLAGSGLFPTGGTANPTLTIAALALRTSRYLQSRMR